MGCWLGHCAHLVKTELSALLHLVWNWARFVATVCLLHWQRSTYAPGSLAPAATWPSLWTWPVSCSGEPFAKRHPWTFCTSFHFHFSAFSLSLTSWRRSGDWPDPGDRLLPQACILQQWRLAVTRVFLHGMDRRKIGVDTQKRLHGL